MYRSRRRRGRVSLSATVLLGRLSSQQVVWTAWLGVYTHNRSNYCCGGQPVYHSPRQASSCKPIGVPGKTPRPLPHEGRPLGSHNLSFTLLTLPSQALFEVLHNLNAYRTISQSRERRAHENVVYKYHGEHLLARYCSLCGWLCSGSGA